jgi:hypothetical protein
MSNNRTLSRLMIATAVLTPTTFLLAIPWLKNQSEGMVFLLAFIAATITVVSSMVLAVLKDQRMDEWHRTAARFSNQWGWLVGAGIFALLMGIPPIQKLVYTVALHISHNGIIDEQTVILTFMFGFMSVVMLQTLSTVILSVVWRYRMSR